MSNLKKFNASDFDLNLSLLKEDLQVVVRTKDLGWEDRLYFLCRKIELSNSTATVMMFHTKPNTKIIEPLFTFKQLENGEKSKSLTPFSSEVLKEELTIIE